MLRTGFWAATGTTLGGLGLGFINFFWPRRAASAGAAFTIPAEEVPAPGAAPRLFVSGRFYLVNLEPGGGVPESFRGQFAASERGGLLALAQKCPHLGCAVPWRGDFAYAGSEGWFRCPCHMSTYTSSGLRVFGPAPRPMDTLALRRNRDGSVTVDTSRITKGGPDNPRRAVAV
jgi:cytochrome b6-f complex iron-sulfur subunit